MSEIKLCRDCKHYDQHANASYCEAVVSLITGEPMRVEVARTREYIEGCASGICGRKGEKWEPNE